MLPSSERAPVARFVCPSYIRCPVLFLNVEFSIFPMSPPALRNMVAPLFSNSQSLINSISPRFDVSFHVI